MTRHLITKTLLAASALTVLAAAPSAMAAPEHKVKVKTKQSQSVKKVANNKVRNTRINNRSNRNSRSLNRNNRSSSINVRSNNVFSRVASSSFRNRGFSTPYRSSLGISFSFGSPGYSRYRWSPSAYSLYRPSYGTYGSYQTRTSCRNVVLDGLHYGRPALISVKECSNPWDGSYIVQGSERIIDSRW